MDKSDTYLSISNDFELIDPREGPKLKFAVKKFQCIKREIEGINLNKVVLSNFIKNYIYKNGKNQRSLIKKIIKSFNTLFFEIINSLKALFLLRMALSFERKGNINMWFITAKIDGLRHSYQEEIQDYLSSSKRPHIVTWKLKKIDYNLIKLVKRLFKFLKTLRLFIDKDYPLSTALHFSRISIYVFDLIEDFHFNKTMPEIIYSLKDFQHYENGIVQAANILGIKTFTSQHCVFPEFKGKNYRFGQAFQNCESNYLMSWGSFNEELYKQYSPTIKIIRSAAILRPKIINRKSNSEKRKHILVIALSGRRHEKEAFRLITIVKKIEKSIFFDEIIIRLHPTIEKTKYENIINKYNFQSYITIEQDKENFEYKYPLDSTIIISTLSGVYYDLLYLGYKTIFYDFGFELEYELPRALSPAKNIDEILSQIEVLGKMSEQEWISIVNPVLTPTLNLNIRERRSVTLVEEIWNWCNKKEIPSTINI